MNDLAPHSRVWIFQANRFLTDTEVEHLQSTMNSFVSEWAAHGNELYGKCEVVYNLFVTVAVDEQRAPASGCSIDKLMKQIQALGAELNVDFLDRLTIAYEDPSTQIHLASMAEFKTLIANQEVTLDTVVYNNLVENLGQMESGWRTEVENSWHKNLLQTS